MVLPSGHPSHCSVLLFSPAELFNGNSCLLNTRLIAFISLHFPCPSDRSISFKFCSAQLLRAQQNEGRLLAEIPHTWLLAQCLMESLVPPEMSGAGPPWSMFLSAFPVFQVPMKWPIKLRCQHPVAFSSPEFQTLPRSSCG